MIDWQPPKAEVLLTGTVTYRCDACGQKVTGEATLYPLDAGELTDATRAYHPEHVPQEVNRGS